MKLKMAPNSLFAVLLRSPWWISLLIALVMGGVAAALLPADYKGAGAVSGFPFAVIGAIAAWRQWRLPSAARVARTTSAVSALAWPAFAALLTRAFEQDGYQVQAVKSDAYDLRLERRGHVTLVAARRWKVQRVGLEALRALQAARDADGAAGAILVSLGALTDQARPYAAAQGLSVWDAPALAQALADQPIS